MKVNYLYLMSFLILTLAGCQRNEAPQPETDSASKEKSKAGQIQQQGPASWYGDDFHGQKTASGEIFNQNELTAASKTLPLGSKAEVTNTETGEKVTVRVTDRGPYVGKRIMDLSKAAAEEIGIKKEGVAEVKIKAKKPAKKISKASKQQKLAKQ